MKKFLLVLAIFLSLLYSCDSGVDYMKDLGPKIAFASDRDGNNEIYVMNADGSGQKNLTNNPPDDNSPAWSPDGSKIAFVSNRAGNKFFEIYVMNADGSGVKQLTTNTAADSRNNFAADICPAWSPDGTKIAFCRWSASVWEIFLMSVDGNGQQQITSSGADCYYPTWSPDGGEIAYYNWSTTENNWKIFVINTTTRVASRLTNNASDFDEEYPSWSPDGNKIAFISGNGGSFKIYLMNANGTGQPINLTNTRYNDYWPTWSPDSSKIAFERDKDGNHEIYVMNTDGTGQKNITNSPGNDRFPAWWGRK
jgi:Tol biopolymer transport system component